MSFLGRLFDRILHSLFMSAVLTLSFHVLADQVKDNPELVPEQLQALQNPEKLAEIIKNNPSAQQLLQQGGDPQKAADMMIQMMRNISSEVGGLEGIQKIKDEVEKDPKKAFDNLNDDQRQLIEAMGVDVKALEKQLDQLNQ